MFGKMFVFPGLKAIRTIPLFIYAIFFGTFVTILNPGLFWDDWVWVHQSPEENIRISKELGIWWAGYLSNAIYKSPNPVLLLRVVALLGWVAASASFAYCMYKIKFTDKVESFMLFALLCATHLSIVRFLNSVAMYNVYIASFWIGCAILVTWPRHLIARFIAALFFFFSFHLNSMIVSFALVVAVMFGRLIMEQVELQGWKTKPEPAVAGELAIGPTQPPVNLGRFSYERYKPLADLLAHKAEQIINYFKSAITKLVREQWLFLLLPFLFFFSVKFVSLTMSTVLSEQQRIYSDYNSIHLEKLFNVLPDIPKQFFESIRLYFNIILVSVPSSIINTFVIGAVIFSLLLPRSEVRSTLMQAGKMLLGAIIIYAFAVYPYLVVGKPPIIFDFYEARNIMPGMAGIALAMIAIIHGVAALLKPLPVRFVSMAKTVSTAVIIGLAMSAQFVFGTDLTKDWLRQQAIHHFMSENKTRFEDYGTFLFVDKSIGFRMNNRLIWNYEYTGLLVDAYKNKTKLGISLSEYMSWPAQVPLVQDPVYRRRYNLTDYDPSLRQLIVEINNTNAYPRLREIYLSLRKHWTGEPVGPMAREYFSFGVLEQLTEAKQHFENIDTIVKSLEKFKAETGVYPYTTVIPPRTGANATVNISVRLQGEGAVPGYINEFPRLSPRYGMNCSNVIIQNIPIELDLTTVSTPICVVKVACFRPQCGYLFMSNGVDYKLIFLNPPDFKYAQLAFPDRIDAARGAYGVWTPAAARW